MQRNSATFSITDTTKFKQQILIWANQFSICCCLDNHHYEHTISSYEYLVGAGAVETFSAEKQSFNLLDNYLNPNRDWLFGHLSYNLTYELNVINSSKQDQINFPPFYFFRPAIVVALNNGTVEISSLTTKPENVLKEILQTQINAEQNNYNNGFTIHPRLTKEAYIATIHLVQQHILRGDCYELNFCQEFFAEQALINPLQVYQKLIAASPNPFAAYYKTDNRFLLCASPERYLRKDGSSIISQPIKGTVKRDLINHEADELLRSDLYMSSKDRAENVMVVDLVRNDMSKICKEGTVSVEELFGIYSFPQVHQMISTIYGELNSDISFTDIIKASFPMGSMTGAPKKKVIELIEKYEPVNRGIFSGTLGYITPQQNFDFNVVIRSILYNEEKQYLSYFTGSGITFYSDAEKEYEECLLKGSAIESVLKNR